MGSIILSTKQKQSVIKLLENNFLMKDILDTMNISYRSYNNSFKSDVGFKTNIELVRNKNKFLNELEIDNLVNKYYQEGDIKRSLKQLGIPYSKHLKTKKKSKGYNKRLLNIREERTKKEQLIFLNLYQETLNLRETMSRTCTSKYKFKHWINQDSFKRKLRKVNSVKLNTKPHKISKLSLPKELWGTNRIGESFYRNGRVVGHICNDCSKRLPINHYYLNNNTDTGYNKTCIDCYSIKYLNKKPERRGEFRNGRLIKKFNSVGNVTHRRCTNCEDMKPLNQFDKLYNKIHVCRDCFKLEPNFHQNKKGEFDKNGNLIRIYDKNFYVIEKICNHCGIMKDLNEFSKNNSNRIDGRVSKCKKCSKS